MLLYQIDRVDEGIGVIASLWGSVEKHRGVSPERQARIKEDYGVMAFNVGLAKQDSGEMRAALGYLLQSEATDFSHAARAAFAVSRLLRNDIQASLAAALRAEGAIDQMPEEEGLELLRHIVELYRRTGDRGRALEYVRKLQGV